MITERKYKNASKIVKQYEAQLAEAQKKKLLEYNISLQSDIHELYMLGLISSRLCGILRSDYDYTIMWNDTRKFNLEFFVNHNIEDFKKYRGVGKKTLDEFIVLMESAKATI